MMPEVVAQVGRAFLVLTRGSVDDVESARGRIVDLEDGKVFGEVNLPSLLRTGYWGSVTDKKSAQQALDMVEEGTGV